MLSNFLTGRCSSTLLAAEASAGQGNFSPHATDVSNAASACKRDQSFDRANVRIDIF